MTVLSPVFSFLFGKNSKQTFLEMGLRVLGKRLCIGTDFAQLTRPGLPVGMVVQSQKHLPRI